MNRLLHRPIEFLRASGWRTFWFVIVALGVIVAVGSYTQTTRPGIIAIELLGTRDGALAILRALPVEDRGPVIKAVSWDYLLIVLYALGGYMAIRLVASRVRAEGNLLDKKAAGWFVGAGIFDCLENVGLLVILNIHAEPLPPWIATVAPLTTVCSLIKWTLICFCVGHLIWLLLLWALTVVRRMRAGGSGPLPARTET